MNVLIYKLLTIYENCELYAFSIKHALTKSKTLYWAKNERAGPNSPALTKVRSETFNWLTCE